MTFPQMQCGKLHTAWIHTLSRFTLPLGSHCLYQVWVEPDQNKMKDEKMIL